MIRLGRLKTAAQFFHNDTFEVWDRTENAFSAGFTGRIYPFDRFKTIYHRPTRRETLGVTDAVTLPDSRVVRHTATQEVFMVCDSPRYDSDLDQIYDKAFALHRPLGLAELVRPVTVGTGDDLGPLIDSKLGQIYYDMELRTGENVDLSLEQMKGRFFATFSTDPELEVGDFIVACAKTYRVNLVYIDGGFQLARVDDVYDEREDMTYHLNTGSGGSYNATTGVVTQTTESDRIFSGLVHPISLNDERDVIVPSDKITVYVGKNHIGFEPKINEELTRSGTRYAIYDITTSSESRQWVLKCRETD